MSNKKANAYLFILPWDIHHAGGVNQVVTNLYSLLGVKSSERPLLLINDWRYRYPAVVSDGHHSAARLRLRSPWNRDHPFRAVMSYLLFMPSSIYIIRKFIKYHGVRVVNPHYPTLEISIFALLKRTGLYRGKFIISFHGLDIAHATESHGIERRIWKWIAGSADALVACSRSLADKIIAFVPSCRERVYVVHNGVDAARLISDSERGGSGLESIGKKPFILNIATFEHKKGQDLLIRAFHKVHSHFPEYRLVLIGRSNPAQSQLLALAEKLEIADHVIFVNDLPHEQISGYLKAARLFVLPSRSEPFGIVILEAGVFALPVVASAVGGVREILDDGLTGRLVEAENSSELACAIEYMLGHPDEARRMGEALKDLVIRRYTWQASLSSYLSIAGQMQGK